MRAVRDIILIACAVISTACLMYFVYNIEVLRGQLAEASATMQTIIKRASNTPKKDSDSTDAEPTAPASGDGYSKPARDSLKKLIEKPATK